MRPHLRFNPPPNWPTPPLGWSPPPGWVPPSSFPQPPPGWPLWVEVEPSSSSGAPTATQPLLSRDGLATASQSAQRFSRSIALIAAGVGVVGVLLPWASVADTYLSTHGYKNGLGWVFKNSDAMGRVMHRADMTLPGWIVLAMFAWVAITTINPLPWLLSRSASLWSRVAASAVAAALILFAWNSVSSWVDSYNTGVEEVAPGAGLSASSGMGVWVALLASLAALAMTVADLVVDRQKSTRNPI